MHVIFCTQKCNFWQNYCNFDFDISDINLQYWLNVLKVRQGVRTGLGHGGITCVLQTQFSSFFLSLSMLIFHLDDVWCKHALLFMSPARWSFGKPHNILAFSFYIMGNNVLNIPPVSPNTYLYCYLEHWTVYREYHVCVFWYQSLSGQIRNGLGMARLSEPVQRVSGEAW